MYHYLCEKLNIYVMYLYYVKTKIGNLKRYVLHYNELTNIECKIQNSFL